MDTNADVILTGEETSYYFGVSVSTAGDFNNDGYDDVIVGSLSHGSAYIYYGSRSMDSNADVIMKAEKTSRNFGKSVSTAGDINNDGYDDVIVVADFTLSTSHYPLDGKAYIYSGPEAPLKFPEKHFELLQNYPNPFNPSTKITYSLPDESKVKIEIFNTLGQYIDVLINAINSAGSYKITWNAENLSSGVYFIRIVAEGLNFNKNFLQVKKALLLK